MIGPEEEAICSNCLDFEPIDEEHEPIFDLESLAKPIHPAIGVFNDTAYVGVWLPTKAKDKEGNEYVKEEFFLITSNREYILATKSNLKELGLKFSFEPFKSETRWSLKDIQDWLNGSTVNPLDVYNNILATWRYYIEFEDERAYHYWTLWTVGTYFMHLFNAYPYIYFGGLKRVGKTKALTLLYCLASNAVFSMNLSTSALFRLIQATRATILIDESEKLSNPERAQDFRAMLLSGYKRGALVYRVEKNGREQLKPLSFDVYAPKALANISGLEDVLEDRVHQFILRRGLGPQIDREIDISNQAWMELRGQLYKLYLQSWKFVKAIYDWLGDPETTPETSLKTCGSGVVSVVSAVCEDTRDKMRRLKNEIKARNWELWRPILALALFFSVYSQTTETTLTTLDKVIELAKDMVKAQMMEDVTETGEVVLVKTLLEMVVEDGYYKVKDVVLRMEKEFDEPQKWLNTKWVGRALKRLGFKEKRRVGPGVEYRFRKEEVERLALKLGVSREEENPQSSEEKLMLERLEAYVREAKSVGVANVLENLNLTMDQLRMLVANSKNITWGGNFEVLNWKPKKGEDIP